MPFKSTPSLCKMLSNVITVSLAISCMVKAAPPGFPSSGNGLWYNSSGTIWSRHYLPVSNGFLAAMTPGGALQESTQLNIESLWAGGPSANSVRLIEILTQKASNLRSHTMAPTNCPASGKQ